MKSFAQRKGKDAEREIANLLTLWTGVKYRRTPASGGIHEFNPWDLMKIENKPSPLDGYGIEVKNTASLNFKEWLGQVKTSMEDSETSNFFLIFKERGKWNFMTSDDNLYKFANKGIKIEGKWYWILDAEEMRNFIKGRLSTLSLLTN